MRSMSLMLKLLWQPPTPAKHPPAKHASNTPPHGEERWSHLPATLAETCADIAARSRQVARERLM